jgi:hypothetical protein
MVTHPSIEARAQAIGAAGGLTETEIARLLEGERVEGAHYPAHPAGDPETRVFSTTAKTVIVSRNSLTMMGVALLMPAAAFAALRDAPHGFGLVAALLLAPAACLFVFDFFAVQPLHAMAARVARRVGLPPRPREAGWALAGLAPHAEPRVYEGFSNWDLGFVRVSDGRLEYLGEETRFALGPDRITRVERVRAPGWIPLSVVRVTWRDDEGGLHALRLSPLDGIGLHSVAGRSRKLAARIESLANGEASGRLRAADSEAILASALPPRGEITCMNPRALVKPGVLIQFLVFDALLGTIAALLYRRPFDPTRAGSFFEVVAVAFATQLFLMIPLWRHRDSAGAPESASSEQKRAA